MIGVSTAIQDQFGEAALERLLGRRSSAVGRYDRGGAVTSPLPLREHMYYAGSKGWTLVEIVDLGGTVSAAPGLPTTESRGR